MPHRIPLKQLVDLIPPTRDSPRFRYFAPWAGTPFEPAQRRLTLANAGWLMEAALLAWSPPRQATRIFQRFNPRPTSVEFLDNAHRDIECYLLVTREAVIVVFRGSQLLRPDRWGSTRDAIADFESVLLDWTGNANLPLVPLRHRSPRRVHSGFLASFESIWPQLGARLAALRGSVPALRFWFTGHSLGGALATLAADRFGHGTLVTFGAPRVGNGRFAATFRRPAWRVINNSDIVTWVPPPWLGGYKHVGRSWLISADGNLIADPSWFRELFDFVHGHLENVRGLLHGRLDAIALECLYDHSPLMYVRRLRTANGANLTGVNTGPR